MQKPRLDQRLNYRLGMLSHRWSALIAHEARGRFKLNTAAIKLLSVVARYQPVSPGEVMSLTSFDSPKVARVIAALAGAGLVSRGGDPADGRRAVLRVTESGAALNHDIDAAAVRLERRVMATLTADERRTLARVLEKLEAGLKGLGGPGGVATS